MQLFKFLLGILLVQAATVTLVLLSPPSMEWTYFIRLGMPLFFIALMVSLWFTSLSAYFQKDRLEKVKSSFASEREEFRVKAEEAKTKVIKDAQREIAKEAKMTHAKANFKVGASFAGVLGVGALFIFAQMMTAGLLVLTATGGAMGGYFWRGKRIANNGGGRLKELKRVNPKEITLLKE